MNESSSNAIGPTGRQEQRWLVPVEIALVIALIVADYQGAIPFTSIPLWFCAGWLSLRLRGLRWRDVGFARPGNWTRAVALGIGAGVGMELFSTFVSVPLLSRLTGEPPDLSDFRFLVGKPGMLAVTIAFMWPLAAFGEELVYRGYLMSRVAGLGGGTRGAWGASLVGVSALFGLGHEGQALTGMVQEGFAALLLGLLYLGCGRTLPVPIIAHGVSNTVAFVLIYFDRYPGV
jgi:hypothetical protein